MRSLSVTWFMNLSKSGNELAYKNVAMRKKCGALSPNNPLIL